MSTISKIQLRIIKYKTYRKLSQLYDSYGMEGIRIIEGEIKNFRLHLLESKKWYGKFRKSKKTSSNSN